MMKDLGKFYKSYKIWIRQIIEHQKLTFFKLFRGGVFL